VSARESVPDLESALELAHHYQRTGAFDLFRGQTADWPLQPKIFRPGVDPVIARERLEQFTAWAERSTELQSLHCNEDAMLAIAQHYGIPTPLLDWTTNPDVAGFFATERPTPGECVIFCLEAARLEELRIVRLDVPDLRRVQSQSGLFLDVRIAPSLLERLGAVHRIVFPYTGLCTVRRDLIDPLRKSRLEIDIERFVNSRSSSPDTSRTRPDSARDDRAHSSVS
jgi:hypothetical protein